MNTTNVLLIDDDEEDYIITRDLFREIGGDRKYHLDWVSNFEEARIKVFEKKHHAYLVDYRLGVHSGLELIGEFCNEQFDAPFILLTGQREPEIDELALQAGAIDFLIKGLVTSTELERTIRYGLQHFRHLSDIRALNLGLEKSVVDRTSELEKTVKTVEDTNEILREEIQKREKAEKRMAEALEREKMLNELKSRFITMASHEFRTPLGTILSSINLLAHYTKDAKHASVEKHFSRIKSNIEHLTDLLNDVLSLEKLEAGKIIVSPENINFLEHIISTIEEMQDIAKDGQKIIHAHEDFGGEPELFLDKRHLSGILINILSNAIKYSGENSEILVKTASYPDKHKIEIADSGIGIPVEEHGLLFDRFFRARNATNIAGTGLGLNIVKKYLDLMDGSITFESEPGRGTKFIVEIPKNGKP